MRSIGRQVQGNMEEGGRLGITVDARYRTVPETQIVEHLSLYFWASRLHVDERAAVLKEVGQALERSVEAGLPFERSWDGQRRFDPAEVIDWIKWASIRRGDPFWRVRCLEAGRSLICEFHGVEGSGGIPPSPKTLGPRRFSVRLQREFNVEQFPPSRSIRLRLPLPLEGPTLRELEITSTRALGADCVLQVGPARLDAQIASPRGDVVTLEAQLSFTAYPTFPQTGPEAITAEDIELYTRPNEGLIRIDARIRALADQLVGTLQEPWTVVQRIWDFVLDRLTFGMVHYDELGSGRALDWVLDSGWCDCQLGSALLVALLRARGLPARMVSGYVLYSARPCYHYWLEVWIAERGWLPLDLICADLSVMSGDRRWRDYFLGSLDYRMQTQRLPRLFDRSPALSFPPRWYSLERPRDDGAEIGFYEYGSGALIYRDRLSVQ